MIQQPWIDKYHPQKIDDLIGNQSAIQTIEKWLDQWPKSIQGKKRTLLIFGPTGVGKTVTIHVIARELGFDVSEINASNKRSKKAMIEILRTATTSGSLVGERGRVILVDELAGLSGKADRGAVSGIESYLTKTRVPIILVTIDITDRKISSLRRSCKIIEFLPLQKEEITEFLKGICFKEQVRYDDMALMALAEYARGDLRAAINDLQSVVQKGGDATIETVQRLIKWRDRTIQINETLDRIFYAETWTQAITAVNQTDVNPDELMRWISSNIPSIFHDTSQLAKAYFWLTKASIYSRRIRQTQNWKLLPYYKEMMCITGSITGGNPTSHRPDYHYPEWINQMWRSKSIRQKQMQIGEILSPLVHTSSKKAYREYLVVLKALLSNPSTRPSVTKNLDLTEDLVSFILQKT